MRLRVLNSIEPMAAILAAPAERRPALLEQLWQPVADMFRHFPGSPDLLAAHRNGFGFDLDRSEDERLHTALAELSSAGVERRMTAALHRAVDDLCRANPDFSPPDVSLLLVLGDPDNRHFVDEVQGLSAFGGISGQIVLTVWPSPVLLNRLEAVVAHEVHHNLRYSPGGVVWDPSEVTVGEQVIAEGLADCFAALRYGAAGWSHFVAPSTRTDDRVLAKVVSGLSISGMQNFTAWVHGDASAALFGVDPVGLPTGAGYAVGARLVEAHLEQTGRTAAECLHTPASEIIAGALPRLGDALRSAGGGASR